MIVLFEINYRKEKKLKLFCPLIVTSKFNDNDDDGDNYDKRDN